MLIRRLTFAFNVLLAIAIGLLIFARDWPPFGTEEEKLNAIVSQQQFDFLVWEVNAFATKAKAALAGGHLFLDEADRKQLVLDYLALLRRAQELDGQINALYVDPNVTDPAAAAADLLAELTAVRQQITAVQPLAEAIVQDQVAAVLADEGFDMLQQAWPPVLMHMTPLPTVLIVSPRDRIERIYQRTLEPGLTTPDKEEMETAVTHNLDLSALIVPIGGMGTYPAMVQETSNLNWLAEVTAHEWGHHWMSFYPVGIYYNDPEVRVINETIASLIDQEIGAEVIRRFYPEFVPPPPPEPAGGATTPPSPTEPPPFDFNAEMAATRIRVDALLAEGKIEEAENYMEERRQLFVANGYQIRKLNQAYFAFYGAYADRPGATGSDPTGPMLQEIRTHSPSLRAFMDTIAPIRSRADLERIWRETTGIMN
ncbi:MAG: hypothetical protein HND44_18545 [Chloroflexi bacterium]|nr:hypothetical protein [Ardenticatenaceae bacterium]MBL1130458.1 hypothetical protein [Chloroflexota bacterium]NOG36548.1 hypothetical protein [Chloroflexota bacterium]GIK57769.1 MAG: hypothetical protein BroJett015_34320 [Chloroflexota bacterium]